MARICARAASVSANDRGEKSTVMSLAARKAGGGAAAVAGTRGGGGPGAILGRGGSRTGKAGKAGKAVDILGPVGIGGRAIGAATGGGGVVVRAGGGAAGGGAVRALKDMLGPSAGAGATVGRAGGTTVGRAGGIGARAAAWFAAIRSMINAEVTLFHAAVSAGGGLAGTVARLG